MTKCERFLICGRVQGVGFRYAVLHEARRLGVTGWARNLPDGRVEVLAKAESGILDELFNWLQKGPPAARVTGVERLAEPDTPMKAGFEIN